MKQMIFSALLAGVVLCGRVAACVDQYAAYYTGIVLNGGEEINLERIEQLAGSDNAYVKDCFTPQDMQEGSEVVTDSAIVQAKRALTAGAPDATEADELCCYRMRSEYREGAMVFIGYDESSLGLFGSVPRLIVFFDTSEVPTAEEKTAALVNELRRFSELGITPVGEDLIARMVEAFGTESGQYWSDQDTVLQFNMWFDGGSVNGVRGVKGVYGTLGCGSGVGYALPESAFATSGVSSIMTAGLSASGKMTVGRTTKGVTVNFTPVHGSTTVMKIFDLVGRVVVSVPLVQGTSQYTLSGNMRTGMNLTPGRYLVSLVERGTVIASTHVTLAD